MTTAGAPGGGRGRPTGARWTRARGVLLPLAIVLVSAALVLVFRGGASANPLSRALTVLGLVEDGSLRADRWFDLTIDRAIVDGHVFSEKPPLSSLVVVPFYALWRALHPGPYGIGDAQAVVILGDVVAAALPFGVFVLLLQRRAAAVVGPRQAVWAALLAAFGTPLFSYGGTYFGHMLSGTLFVLAYEAATGADSAPRPDRSALLAGLFAGLSVTTELTLWIGTLALGAFLASRRAGARRVAFYVAGGLPCALAFEAYNTRVTGSPFDWPYAHVTSLFYNPPALRFDVHTLAAARALLVGEYRGLFFYAPALLVLAPLACLRTLPPARRVLLAAFTGAYFVFVASYWAWPGGWCIGPRHLTPVIMVFLYEGLGALGGGGATWRRAFFGLASLGVAENLLAVATNPRVEGSTHPFRDLYWPAFAHGEMTTDSLFNDLGLTWGRATTGAWCLAFLAAASLLAWAAKRASAGQSRKLTPSEKSG